MRNFKKTYLCKGIIWLLLLTITLYGCDPNGTLASEMHLEDQSEQIAKDFKTKYGSEVDCNDIADYIRSARNFALSKKAKGIRVNQEDILGFIVSQEKMKGDPGMQNLSSENLAELQKLLEEYRLGVLDENPAPLFNFMVGKGLIDVNVREHFTAFEKSLKNVASEDYEATIEVIDRHATAVNNDRKIDASQKAKLIQSFDSMRSLVCGAQIDDGIRSGKYQQGDNFDKDDCTIELCFEQYTWVFALILVFIILTILILIFSFFLPPLAAVAISISVWTVVAVLTCERLSCEPDPPCPDGQRPFCQGTLAVFNADINKCQVNFDELPVGVFIQNDCFLINRTIGQPCPFGTTPGGSVCVIECYTFDVGEQIQQDNEERRFLFDNECI